jgi:nitric oxide synthase oxygenase domain/subunit
MAAQTAVSFIKKGCDMLHQGRMELEGAKKTVEGVMADVKAIKGIWQWLISLLSGNPKSNSTKSEDVSKPLAKAKVASKKQQTYEEVELQTINEVGIQLGNFFDIQAQLNNYYASLEAESKERYDPTQNTSKKAIERALVELQMENLDAQIREQMTVYAPVELKAIYTRFLKMYAKIQQEQEWARSEEVKKLRKQRWEQEQQEIFVIELVSGGVAIVFISTIFGWLMWQLQNLSGGF